MENMASKSLNKRWAVVGFDHDRALDIINNIQAECGKEISKMIRTKFELRMEFADGTVLFWVKASDGSRGRKFGKMWCDKKIDKDILHCVIYPCYFGKREDIVWVE